MKQDLTYVEALLGLGAVFLPSLKENEDAIGKVEASVSPSFAGDALGEEGEEGAASAVIHDAKGKGVTAKRSGKRSVIKTAAKSPLARRGIAESQLLRNRRKRLKIKQRGKQAKPRGTSDPVARLKSRGIVIESPQAAYIRRNQRLRCSRRWSKLELSDVAVAYLREKFGDEYFSPSSQPKLRREAKARSRDIPSHDVAGIPPHEGVRSPNRVEEFFGLSMDMVRR